ncbi:MAG: A/G-specific adenine glycosylase [Candidatus Neomarinimicrobiota bacterium]|nr:A/G-specific adenine glycosylase [Candidatus Neomarinimicrobiota bacterium]
MYYTNNNSILDWYDINKRNLPWRLTKDPYKIWLSEVMLQQTQVSTVIPYYENWIRKFPTVDSVAKVNIDEALKMWEGLGYYKRCRNFHSAAKIIVSKHNGMIPNSYNILLSLPGVGNYVASAILSIAFNKKFAAIDTNLNRVISRILGIKKLTKWNKNRINKYATLLVEHQRPGDVNQALMDIGSQLCTTKKALCSSCPNQNICKAFQSSNPLQFPQILAKKPPRLKKFVAGYISLNKNIIINKRPNNVMLGGLWQLPTFEFKESEKRADIEELFRKKVGKDINIEGKIGIVKHEYSHLKAEVALYLFSKKNNSIKLDDSKWIKINDVDKYAFSNVNHKLIQLMRDKKND